MNNKNEAIEIAQIKRTRKRIEIAWSQGESLRSLAERDNPLPSFTRAFDALAPLVSTICHLPADYSATNLRVVGIIVGAQGGAVTAQLVARKGLDDASKEFVFRTPARMLSDPSEEGSYSPPLSAGEAELIEEVIEEAKRYIRGDRAQGQIAFEEDAEDGEDSEDAKERETDKTAELPIDVPPGGNGKKKKKKLISGEVIEITVAGGTAAVGGR